MISSNLIVLILFLVPVFCQYQPYLPNQPFGPLQYCINLEPPMNFNIPSLTGTWFGVEVITHLDMISREKPRNDCIYVVITEINGYGVPQISNVNQNLRTNVTKLPEFKNLTSAAQVLPYTRFLRIEWTDLNERFEYIARYNLSRVGFWMTSAPRQYQTRGPPNYEMISGNIQVISYDENHLVLTFCQTMPTRKLFSLLLSRRLNGLSLETRQRLRNKLSARGLRTITQRRVCNGVESINKSYFLAIVATIICIVQFKWSQLYTVGI